jgi:hypothetical protein
VSNQLLLPLQGIVAMSEPEKPVSPSAEGQFQKQADEPQVGLVREFIDFLRYNKAWWLTPIIIVLLMVGGLLYLAAVGGPLIYSIF